MRLCLVKKRFQFFSIPYVTGIGEKFIKIKISYITVAFTGVNKLRRFIRVFKDPVPINVQHPQTWYTK